MLRKYYILLYVVRKERTMKQSKLVEKMYQASLSHDEKMIQKLRKLEFEKIINRKAKGKPFTSKWTLADGL